MERRIASIDRVATIAVLRAELECGEGRASFGVDLAMSRHAPSEHFIGVDVDLFDKARVDAMQGQSAQSLLHELDVRLGIIFNSADLEKSRVVFWPGPHHDDAVIAGAVLRLHFESPSSFNIDTMAEAVTLQKRFSDAVRGGDA